MRRSRAATASKWSSPILPGSYLIELNHKTVFLKNLPAAFEDLTITQLSDLHFGVYTGAQTLRACVGLANRLGSDLVALTGDYISHSVKHIRACAEMLAQLRAPLGVFAVLGNHDHWNGAETVASHLERAGIQVLRNRNHVWRRDGGSVALAGIDDLWSGKSDLTAALRGLDDDSVRVLLSHNPDVFEKPAARHFDLVLSGHTHGGQIVLPLIGPAVVPSRYGRKYLAGLITDGQRHIHINRGIGATNPPFRFRCPAEITVLHLKSGPRP
ncbi:MAG: metallophosphoesterase [Acidobacteriota bacterium]